MTTSIISQRLPCWWFSLQSAFTSTAAESTKLRKMSPARLTGEEKNMLVFFCRWKVFPPNWHGGWGVFVLMSPILADLNVMRGHSSRSRPPTSWGRGQWWSLRGRGWKNISPKYLSWGRSYLDIRLSRVKGAWGGGEDWGLGLQVGEEVESGELGARPPFNFATLEFI